MLFCASGIWRAGRKCLESYISVLARVPSKSSPRSSGTSGLCSRLIYAHSLCSFLLYWPVAVPAKVNNLRYANGQIYPLNTFPPIIYILTKSAKVEFWGRFLTFLFFSLLYKYTFLTSFLTSASEFNTFLTLFNVYKVEAYTHCLLHPSVGFNDCFFLATHCHQAKHCEKCYGFNLFFH